jgi:hypothetical protein
LPQFRRETVLPLLLRMKLEIGGDAMFERGDPFPWLDQCRHPWVSLTNAAVYLSQRDSTGRSRAVYRHEWALPFEILLEWIEADLLTVYEAGAEPPFRRIRTEEFLRIPIKFPSYTLADGLESLSRFEPGRDTFIECKHNLSRLSPAKDRYFARNRSEPRWFDLRVASAELVAALRTVCSDAPQWVARSELTIAQLGRSPFLPNRQEQCSPH